MKDMGHLKYFFLGIYLSQCKCALKIIYEAGLLGSKSVSTPLEPNHNLAKATSTLCTYYNRYRRLVGKLIYLSITRQYISYAIYTMA